MKKILLHFAFILFLPFGIFAQADTAFNSFLDEFNQFNASSSAEFNSFHTEINAEFVKFLDTAWKEFEVYSKQRPLKNKPVQQPICTQTVDSIVNKIEITPQKTDTAVKKSEEILELNKRKAPKYDSKTEILYFNFYGRKDGIIYRPEYLPSLNDISNEAIKSFHEGLIAEHDFWAYNIQQLKKHKAKYGYNDWGYLQLLELVAKQLYKQKSEQSVFMCYMLLHSGYHSRIGYNENQVFLLIPSFHDLYDFQVCTINNVSYYLFRTDSVRIENIKSYPVESEMKLSYFSFELHNFPKLPSAEKIKKELQYNGHVFSFAFDSNNIEFMEKYPQCELKLYFDLELSESVLHELDLYFNPLFANKTDLEKVNVLLNFIHKVIPYKTDEEQFGDERYMFAEECMLFLYADCEDRSILLKQLVRHYTNLSVVALGFPNHCCLAVYFNQKENDEYSISTKWQQEYYICDPTYINATAGMFQPNLNLLQVEIIGIWGNKSDRFETYNFIRTK